MSNQLYIKNISRLVTMNAVNSEGVLGVVQNAALLAKDGVIEWFGKEKDSPLQPDGVKSDGLRVLDARGAVVMPALVECHTHLVHSGSRANEFNLRSHGKTYKDIAIAGGGIMATVRATREATEEQLFESARERVMELCANGVATVEIKTGYGLNLEAELKMARVIQWLHDTLPITIRGTFLGAHTVPAEYKDGKAEYLDVVVKKMLPEIAKFSAITACDVFVDEIAFSLDDARRVCEAARAHGLDLHLHVDQFSDLGGAQLAADVKALSADHLDFSSDSGIDAMKKAHVVPVLLPSASFFAGHSYPSALRMIERGLPVAISTDYNPGTSPTLNLFLTATIAVTQMKMTCEEALLGITLNPALALGLTDRGVVEVGKRADLLILDASSEFDPIYTFGKNLVSNLVVAGVPRW